MKIWNLIIHLQEFDKLSHSNNLFLYRTQFSLTMENQENSIDKVEFDLI